MMGRSPRGARAYSKQPPIRVVVVTRTAVGGGEVSGVGAHASTGRMATGAAREGNGGGQSSRLSERHWRLESPVRLQTRITVSSRLDCKHRQGHTVAPHAAANSGPAQQRTPWLLARGPSTAPRVWPTRPVSLLPSASTSDFDARSMELVDDHVTDALDRTDTIEVMGRSTSRSCTAGPRCNERRCGSGVRHAAESNRLLGTVPNVLPSTPLRLHSLPARRSGWGLRYRHWGRRYTCACLRLRLRNTLRWSRTSDLHRP